MRWVFIVGGAVLTLLGVIWTLQGLNVLGGSPMSGTTAWAIIGPIVAVGGLTLMVVGARRLRPRP